MKMCRTADVELYLRGRGIDTATLHGISLFDLSGLMAFYPRQSRRDRILRGQAAARSAAVKFGRSPIHPAKIAKARQAAGIGVRQAERLAGISPASVGRLKALMESVAP